MIAINRRFAAWKKTVSVWICLMVCATGVAACQAKDAASTDTLPHAGQTVMLTLIAYNYTDHYIDSYSVNGADGGNVIVSGPTTGGSKSGCCVIWGVGRPLPVTVHIRWQSSECIYTKRVEGEDFDTAKSFYSEKDVVLTTPPSSDPKFFETHFYPDGHIEVAITDDYTPPRLKLQRTAQHGRPGVKPEARCTAAQMRQGANQ